jgi:uncharacterized protein YdeI (YjbR/CyaY-like superfamily)
MEIKPVFFKTPAAFRKWLEKNHDKAKEIYVGFYKKGRGKSGITWPEAVDQALCFGWIDGIRKSLDETSYTNRFTPRKPNSNWSAINIKKIEELTEKGLMHSAGIAAFQKRKEERSAIYSYESEAAELSEQFQKKFKKDKKAWAYFHSRSNYYKKRTAHWIMSAKTEETKIRRLEKLIHASGQEQQL